MKTKQQVRKAAKEIRGQSLLLEVYYDDERLVRGVAKKILLIAHDLERSGRKTKSARTLLDAACDLAVAAKLLAVAHALAPSGKKSEEARKLRDMARKLQAPQKLIAIARQLEQRPKRARNK